MNIIVLYGIKENRRDVTAICLTTLLDNNIISIPRGDNNRAYFFNDHLPGIEKSIFIINKIEHEYNQSYDIKIDIINGIIESNSDYKNNIGFFVRHFTERGTEVATYDYAKYNEDILNNKSYIICFTKETQQKINYPLERYSYNKFMERFQIIEIQDICDMTYVIKKYNLTFFYTLTHGGDDIYKFDNKNIWGICKTIKHCVFNTTRPESDFYISISDMLNKKYNTNITVIPHIVYLPNNDDNLRDELQIPSDVIVYGRYGGYSEFNLDITHNAIKDYLDIDKNCVFLFMNTNKFYEHPRIIYLDKNIDLNYKVKFINTCDAMIHARGMGETFGLSIAEFSIKNKPIITCNCGDLEHIKILGDKAIIYNSKEELIHIFSNIKIIINSRSDWNAYTSYLPMIIMNLFKHYIFNKY